ncbi:MAG: PDZ domain-containing protein [Akkermansiaceae bacterium]|jgi:C-terminal processing protease CtpA/Prc|nr:PDZ domain-containing protein [Akkermansiaceae bacterium]
MKSESNTLLASLLFTLLLPAAAQGQEPAQQNHAEAHAEAHASGEGSHVERKSVTVTTINGRTVRKTTIFRDGKEHTTTEILDADGKVIDGGDDDPQDPQEQDGPQAEDGESRPWIGLRVQEAPEALRAQLGLEENEGAVIDAVAPGGPAEEAGVQVNDLLLKLEGQTIGSPQDLREALENCEVGQQVQLTLLRRGREEQATVVLEEEPENSNPRDRQPQGGRPGENGRDGQNGPPGAHRGQGGEGGNGGSAHAEVEVHGGSLEELDKVLDNPDLPEEFKKNVREMRERMREFEERHGQR